MHAFAMLHKSIVVLARLSCYSLLTDAFQENTFSTCMLHPSSSSVTSGQSQHYIKYFTKQQQNVQKSPRHHRQTDTQETVQRPFVRSSQVFNVTLRLVKDNFESLQRICFDKDYLKKTQAISATFVTTCTCHHVFLQDTLHMLRIKC